MRWLQRQSQPRPPENVRIVYADGREIPVECVYQGRKDGIHQWVAVAPVMAEQGMVIRCDVLPARTSILLRAIGPSPE
jgi:hypothetical protein